MDTGWITKNQYLCLVSVILAMNVLFVNRTSSCDNCEKRNSNSPHKDILLGEPQEDATYDLSIGTAKKFQCCRSNPVFKIFYPGKEQGFKIFGVQ